MHANYSFLHLVFTVFSEYDDERVKGWGADRFCCSVRGPLLSRETGCDVIKTSDTSSTCWRVRTDNPSTTPTWPFCCFCLRLLLLFFLPSYMVTVRHSSDLPLQLYDCTKEPNYPEENSLYIPIQCVWDTHSSHRLMSLPSESYHGVHAQNKRPESYLS